MPQFNYEGFDRSGARISGDIEADSLSHARLQLKQQGFLIKKVTEDKPQAKSLFSSQQISLSDIEFLTTELSVLLDAGLKIDKGIELLRKSNKKPGLAKLLEKLSKELRSGKQLSQALGAADDVFDPLYINLVSIGEATGKLPEVFRSIATDLSFKRDLRQKVIQALTYPMVILLVCVSAIIFIFNYIVPNMESLFSANMDLPLYTQLLLSSSQWMRKYQFFLAIAIGIAVFVFLSVRKRPAVQQWLQRIGLKLPVFSSAVLLVERIRFNSGLSMMLNAGVAVDQALELSAGNIRNLIVRREVDIAINKIKRGELLSAALRQTRLFPIFFASLLAVGEESGELSRIFNEIAQRSQREFSNWVTRMTSLLEPLLILVMGGLVGGVVVIMMLSITGTSDAGL
jgi:type II secretory pathway component PulF